MLSLDVALELKLTFPHAFRHTPPRSSPATAWSLFAVRSKSQIAALEADEIALVDDFSPTFVYPIFGQDEVIFGYKGLNIEVSTRNIGGSSL